MVSCDQVQQLLVTFIAGNRRWDTRGSMKRFNGCSIICCFSGRDESKNNIEFDLGVKMRKAMTGLTVLVLLAVVAGQYAFTQQPAA